MPSIRRARAGCTNFLEKRKSMDDRSSAPVRLQQNQRKGLDRESVIRVALTPFEQIRMAVAIRCTAFAQNHPKAMFNNGQLGLGIAIVLLMPTKPWDWPSGALQSSQLPSPSKNSNSLCDMPHLAVRASVPFPSIWKYHLRGPCYKVASFANLKI